MSIKKILSLLFILHTALFLTSCRVNWFGTSYDVAWWTVALPVTVFVLIVWAAAGRYISSKNYVCPKCGKTFYPKWWAATFSVHINDDRLFKCPHCGKRGFCHVSRDNDN